MYNPTIEECKAAVKREQEAKEHLWASLSDLHIYEIINLLPSGKIVSYTDECPEIETTYKRRSKRVKWIIEYLRRVEECLVTAHQFEGPRRKRRKR